MKRKALLSAMSIIFLSTVGLPGETKPSAINLGRGHTPSIASDGRGHLFVVFEGLNYETAKSDIFFATSNDGGKSWTKRVDVSPTLGVSTRPKVAIEKSGAIDLVWTDTASGENNPDIFFRRSTDSGDTWTRPINISKTPGYSSDPRLAVGEDGTIHVVFTDTPNPDRGRDIFYTFSVDGGKTWETNLKLENVSNTASDSSEPTVVAAPDGTVYIAWKEENTSSLLLPQIYYSRRNHGVWSKGKNISNSRHYSYHPVIACGAAGRIYINWSSRVGCEAAADIWCTGLDNNGGFAEPTLVSDNGSISSIAEMAADQSNRVSVVWSDRGLGEPGPRIRLKLLSNDLRDPHRTIKISHHSDMQLSPALVIDGDNLTIVWEEHTLDTNPIKVRSINLTELR